MYHWRQLLRLASKTALITGGGHAASVWRPQTVVRRGPRSSSLTQSGDVKAAARELGPATVFCADATDIAAIEAAIKKGPKTGSHDIVFANAGPARRRHFETAAPIHRATFTAHGRRHTSTSSSSSAPAPAVPAILGLGAAKAGALMARIMARSSRQVNVNGPARDPHPDLRREGADSASAHQCRSVATRPYLREDGPVPRPAGPRGRANEDTPSGAEGEGDCGTLENHANDESRRTAAFQRSQAR